MELTSTSHELLDQLSRDFAQQKRIAATSHGSSNQDALPLQLCRALSWLFTTLQRGTTANSS
jgi:hypothetical protein